MKKIFAEYKAFALKGNVLDIAIGIVVGGAFATITSSLVANVIAPTIGLFTSGVDLADLFLVLKNGVQGGPYPTLVLANKDGAVTLSYGLFINSVFSFIIVSWFAFILVKGINRIKDAESKQVDKATKNCQFCYSVINIKASKCPQCTANLG
ncbi:large conductance mechanosensitive channel protein MscL [Colwellia sp. MB02u-18]|uniref:large conductance mechanosensitive channel protein MscL n=1 Tax=unclassified Colwellia TaxID=196834 RepID=UPI0015F72533|nr:MULTISPECIES: large conductance mechanosensitive channel protein MscL [unclassified Colwellia]MBA6223638.1 large conductance mechanosensitive channel protein MscL [Colwellia sp. MB3u-45]MBA6267296.1 large conductance mechanosensitive channel protein MscL [Colwellia sp. MB3u-43]MBA6319819.1 large conductance mechanosensitive channel protein MscL [Colwellia sp. MB02u-19]MBA6323802.1 large conductance mechanosensitive channel protein MscL [Colwellia sp. MB02u-18]MBA6330792.1 large conductance 